MNTTAGGLIANLLETNHLRDVQPGRIIGFDDLGFVDVGDGECNRTRGFGEIEFEDLWVVMIFGVKQKAFTSVREQRQRLCPMVDEVHGQLLGARYPAIDKPDTRRLHGCGEREPNPRALTVVGARRPTRCGVAIDGS